MKKIIKKFLGLKKNRDLNFLNSNNYSNEYLAKKKSGKRLILVFTVGRSGSRWLTNIFNEHKNVAGVCEPLDYAEFYYRFIKWNRLPIDDTGVFNLMMDYVVNSWKENDVCVYATPGMSVSIKRVCEVMKPDGIIWAVNKPEFTVNSFFNKGWYNDQSLIPKDDNLLPGLQPGFEKNWNRQFARLIPNEDVNFLNLWNSYTSIGKISWLYTKVNQLILKDYESINIKKMVFKLEEADQNFLYYKELLKYFEIDPTLKETDFLNIKERTVRSGQNETRVWSQLEKKEFEDLTKDFLPVYEKLNAIKLSSD